jgi:hypothetical protein
MSDCLICVKGGMSTSSYLTRKVGLLNFCKGRYIYYIIFVTWCRTAFYVSREECPLHPIWHENLECLISVKGGMSTISYLSRDVGLLYMCPGRKVHLTYLSRDFRLHYMSPGRNDHFIIFVTRCWTALYVSWEECQLNHMCLDMSDCFYASREVCPVYDICHVMSDCLICVQGGMSTLSYLSRNVGLRFMWSGRISPLFYICHKMSDCFICVQWGMPTLSYLSWDVELLNMCPRG